METFVLNTCLIIIIYLSIFQKALWTYTVIRSTVCVRQLIYLDLHVKIIKLFIITKYLHPYLSTIHRNSTTEIFTLYMGEQLSQQRIICTQYAVIFIFNYNINERMRFVYMYLDEECSHTGPNHHEPGVVVTSTTVGTRSTFTSLYNMC